MRVYVCVVAPQPTAVPQPPPRVRAPSGTPQCRHLSPSRTHNATHAHTQLVMEGPQGGRRSCCCCRRSADGWRLSVEHQLRLAATCVGRRPDHGQRAVGLEPGRRRQDQGGLQVQLRAAAQGTELDLRRAAGRYALCRLVVRRWPQVGRLVVPVCLHSLSRSLVASFTH